MESGDHQDQSEAEMYRLVTRQQVLYAHYREYKELADELIELARARGLTVPRLFAPTVGVGNEVIWEKEYPDLAAFERDNDAFHSDTEIMERWRRLWGLVVQGSVHDELLQEAPRIE
jgi:hypothetical protein